MKIDTVIEEEMRAEICRVGKSLYDRGYVTGTAGNISVRLPDDGGFLITPTDACLGTLRPDTLAHVSLQGEQLKGEPASKTLALHRRIYAADVEARCVLHTHSTQLVALTLQGVWSADDVLPPITPYQVMKVGHVPLIPYLRPGSPEMAARVMLAIERARGAGRTIRAVLHERLGPNIWHASLAAAMALLEELEESARLWLMSPTKPQPLTEAQLEDIARAFGTRW
jgi:ribulose-5-phosphate 4-epimerase/fuculose-1-phosphate aldolase